MRKLGFVLLLSLIANNNIIAKENTKGASAAKVDIADLSLSILPLLKLESFLEDVVSKEDGTNGLNKNVVDYYTNFCRTGRIIFKDAGLDLEISSQAAIAVFKKAKDDRSAFIDTISDTGVKAQACVASLQSNISLPIQDLRKTLSPNMSEDSVTRQVITNRQAITSLRKKLNTYPQRVGNSKAYDSMRKIVLDEIEKYDSDLRSVESVLKKKMNNSVSSSASYNIIGDESKASRREVWGECGNGKGTFSGSKYYDKNYWTVEAAGGKSSDQLSSTTLEQAIRQACGY